MSVVVTSKNIYDEFTGTGGGGVTYLNGNVADRMQRIIKFYIEWNLYNVAVEFDATAQTITMINQYDNRTFITAGFSKGDTFDTSGTISNNGSFTIADISTDGKTITTVESLTDESVPTQVAKFDGTTKITSIDYYFNLLKNSDVESYFSLTDPTNEQKFFADGLDCTVTTATNMRIGTKSLAWFTHSINDPALNDTPQVTVKGDGADGYKQKFIITQVFAVVPLYLNDQLSNFQTDTPPDYYNSGNSLKHIFKIGASYAAASPFADHSVSVTDEKGTGAWFNRGALGRMAEYYVSAISYKDNSTSDDLEVLDVDKNCLVTMTLKSLSGKFQNLKTRIFTEFNFDPSDQNDYQNLPTTLRENFRLDRSDMSAGAGPVNGTNYGTEYQSITAATATYVDANTITCTFIFIAGSNLKTFWKSKADDDRYYTIALITQDQAQTKTANHDRVTARADFQSATWNRIDDTLFALTSTGIKSFKYPEMMSGGKGSLNLFQGEACFNEIGFKIPQHAGALDNCTVLNLMWQVVGKKTGEQDFIFENSQIDLSNTKKLINVQQLAYEASRGFISYDGDPCNLISIVRDEANDTSTESAWIAYYGLIGRFEQWLSALEQFYSSDVELPAIAKSFEEITQDWTEYAAHGWSLVLRFTISILNIDLQSTNNYWTEIPITISKNNRVIWTGATGMPTQITQYFTEDGTQEIKSIAKADEGKTLIRTTLSGDCQLADGEQYYGILTAVIQNGNIFSRRLSSSELPSESDSPFSPTEADPDADLSWAKGNSRINIFQDGSGNTTKITLESYFDVSGYDAQSVNFIIQSVISTFVPNSSGS